MYEQTELVRQSLGLHMEQYHIGYILLLSFEIIIITNEIVFVFLNYFKFIKMQGLYSKHFS